MPLLESDTNSESKATPLHGCRHAPPSVWVHSCQLLRHGCRHVPPFTWVHSCYRRVATTGADMSPHRFGCIRASSLADMSPHWCGCIHASFPADMSPHWCGCIRALQVQICPPMTMGAFMPHTGPVRCVDTSDRCQDTFAADRLRASPRRGCAPSYLAPESHRSSPRAPSRHSSPHPRPIAPSVLASIPPCGHRPAPPRRSSPGPWPMPRHATCACSKHRCNRG